MKNASFNTNDVKKCCENKLSIKFEGTKHLKGWYYLDNKKTARITVAKSKKYIPPKTYKSMADQLKLTVEQFDNLLECPLQQKEYKTILKSPSS